MRRIGDPSGAAGALVQQFDPSQYVPADIQNDFDVGADYYQQFSQVAGGVSIVKGTVQISDQASQAALDGTLALVAAAQPELAPFIGAFAAALALLPKAGAGPGVCVLDPPAGPLQSQIRAWSHYVSWESPSGMGGPFNPGAPGSFEAYANPVLLYNWELGANCFSDKQTWAPVLLAGLVSAWNARHQGPTRTITRSGLNPPGWGYSPSYDPIAQALELAAMAKVLGAPPANETFEQEVNRVSSAPNNLTSSFTVNNGALIVHVIPLTLHFPSPTVPTPTSVKAPTSKSSAGEVLAVGAVAAAGFWAWRAGWLAKLVSRL